MIAELTEEKDFYRAMQRLAEVAWSKRMTVEALFALADVLEPPNDAERPACPR
jgi:hypothetical protein